MDPKFQPAIAAIKAGDLNELKSLLSLDPSLATARSSVNHPTLLQCLVLDFVDLPNKIEIARALVDAGAEINGPLVAAASIGNVEAAEALIAAGADINGIGNWSPLEEALYWGNQRVIDLLLERGATVHNLRIAAGLGRHDLIEVFAGDGSLTPAAGKIEWPFGDPKVSNLSAPIREELQAKIAAWPNDRQSIINNAFVYACMHNRLETAKLLREKGAEIDALPHGFDYAGNGLHYAAMNGHQALVEFLVSAGADVTVRDTKVQSTDAGGHPEIRDYLNQIANTVAD
jgi:ankyrin repeat protein